MTIMIEPRPFAELGRFRNAWLNAHHHFSFGSYLDPARMGVGGLRVWNDDEIAPGTGFDTHPHREMEIVTYVREGAISHRDSEGNAGRTLAGDVQVMHAGTGIFHSEHNLENEPTRLFQIWLLPNQAGVTPGWAARRFPERPEGHLIVLADGRAVADPVALALYADAAVLAGRLEAGQTLVHPFDAGRLGYLVVAGGAITLNGVPLGPRDGAAIAGEALLDIRADAEAELVLVDVAPLPRR